MRFNRELSDYLTDKAVELLKKSPALKLRALSLAKADDSECFLNRNKFGQELVEHLHNSLSSNPDFWIAVMQEMIDKQIDEDAVAAALIEDQFQEAIA